MHTSILEGNRHAQRILSEVDLELARIQLSHVPVVSTLISHKDPSGPASIASVTGSLSSVDTNSRDQCVEMGLPMRPANLETQSSETLAMAKNQASPTLSTPSKRGRNSNMNTDKKWRIARSIKMPSGESSGHTRYPFGEMKVGDSIEAPLKAKSAVGMHNKKHPETKFEWRHWDRKKKTIRMWRTT